MPSLLPVLLALATAAPAASTPSAPPLASPDAPYDLMPAFVEFCMNHGPDPRDIGAHLASLGVTLERGSPAGTPEQERVASYAFVVGDRPIRVITKFNECSVATDGVHDAATVGSFDRFLQKAAVAFTVVHEQVPAPTAGWRVASSWQLVDDKGKRFRNRTTLSVGTKDGKSSTIITRGIYAY